MPKPLSYESRTPYPEMEVYMGQKTALAAELEAAYPLEQAMVPGFELDASIEAAPGLCVEIGGPSEFGYKLPLVGPEYLRNAHNRPVLITNIVEWGAPRSSSDLIVDATDMPFDDESVGIVLASCLIRDVRPAFFEETARVLRLGGLCMYRNCDDYDIDQARKLGFDILAYTRYSNLPSQDSYTWSVVLRK